MDLNLHDPFGLPLRAQAFAFFSLAFGAVTLSSINAIVRVALRAVRLLRVDVRKRGRIAPGVFGRCECVQVLVVHARAVTACVVDNVSIWNGASSHPQRDTMSLSRGAAKEKNTIPVTVSASFPDQALSLLLALTEKPLSFLRCAVHFAFIQTARMAPQVISVGELS